MTYHDLCVMLPAPATESAAPSSTASTLVRLGYASAAYAVERSVRDLSGKKKKVERRQGEGALAVAACEGWGRALVHCQRVVISGSWYASVPTSSKSDAGECVWMRPWRWKWLWCGRVIDASSCAHAERSAPTTSSFTRPLRPLARVTLTLADESHVFALNGLRDV